MAKEKLIIENRFAPKKLPYTPCADFIYTCKHGKHYRLRPKWSYGSFWLRCGCEVDTKKELKKLKEQTSVG